jgi:hypothetical protein
LSFNFGVNYSTITTSSSPTVHTFLHHFFAGTRFDLHPLFSPPANVAAIRLLSDDSLDPQFLNRHMPLQIINLVRKGFTVIRLNTIDGNFDVLELDRSALLSHPHGDDLAVASITLPQRKIHLTAAYFVR